jgi:valyl-tRNA synthetase
VLLRLLAPFLPFVTEEVWSWWQEGSIHTASWPGPHEIESCLAENSEAARQADQAAYEWAAAVLFDVRKQRSEAKQPLKVWVTNVTITAEPGTLALMPQVEADLRSALRVRAFETTSGEPREILVAGYEAP